MNLITKLINKIQDTNNKQKIYFRKQNTKNITNSKADKRDVAIVIP